MAPVAPRCGRFRGKESVEQASRRAQSLHDGEVAAPVEDPSHQRRKHAQRRRQNDQRRSSQQRRARLAQHARLALHDLPHRPDVRRRNRLRQLIHDARNFFGRTAGGDFNGRGLNTRPGYEIGQRNINAAVFGCAGLNRPCRSSRAESFPES